MYIDRIDLSLPEALVSSVLVAFASAESQLSALPSLSPSDRKHLAKLGLKNEGLARQIIEVGRSNPDLIPRGIHFEQIDRDLAAREQLLALKLVLERLLGKVNDAMQLTGVDIYAAALSIYHCLKRNADKASVKGVVDELKKGFARPSRKKKAEPEASPAMAAEPKVETLVQPTPSVVTQSEPPSEASGNQFQFQAALPSFAHHRPHTFYLVPALERPQLFSSWSIVESDNSLRSHPGPEVHHASGPSIHFRPARY